MRKNLKFTGSLAILILLTGCFLMEFPLNFLVGGSFLGNLHSPFPSSAFSKEYSDKSIDEALKKYSFKIVNDDKHKHSFYVTSEGVHFKNGDIEKALADFEKAYEIAKGKHHHSLFFPTKERLEKIKEYLKIAPKKALLHYYWGGFHYKLGSLSLALKANNIVHQLDSENFDEVPDWGIIPFINNKYRDSKNFYNRILRKNPDAYKAYFYRAKVNIFEKELRKAEKDLTTYLKHFPKDYEAITLRAETYYQIALRTESHFNKRKIEESASDYIKAYKLKPQTDYNIQEFQRAIGDSSDSLKPLTDVMKFFSPYHDRYLLSLLTEMIQQDSEIYQTFYLRGLLYMRKKEYEDAFKDLNKAVELSKDVDFPFMGRGKAHEILGKYEDAVADYSEVLNIRRKNQLIYNCSFFSPVDSIWLSTITKVSDIYIYYLRARSYYQIEKYEETINDCQEVINYGKAELSKLKISKKDKKNKKEKSEYIAELMNNAYTFQGKSYEALNKPENAIEIYKECLGLKEHLPEDKINFAKERVKVLTDETG